MSFEFFPKQPSIRISFFNGKRGYSFESTTTYIKKNVSKSQIKTKSQRNDYAKKWKTTKIHSAMHLLTSNNCTGCVIV